MRALRERPRRRLPVAQDELKARLDALVAGTDLRARLDADPLGLVRALPDAREREVGGLVAATLAFGNVVAIRRSIGRVFEALDGAPGRAADALDERALRERLRGFVHRVYRGEHVARMLARAGELRRQHGTLGAALAARMTSESSEGLVEGLARWSEALRGPRPARGLAHLLPDPTKGSASKRLFLYLRWMIRPDDGIDLGLFPISPRHLIVPVDTHVHRIAQNLGMTRRKDASLKTAVEITAALRRLDPEDPVRYDFALCHLGVSRECPSRRDEEKCARCVVREVCTRWR
ncbi:MAG: TIGR02757 family protein [Sandaracinus sp.]